MARDPKKEERSRAAEIITESPRCRSAQNRANRENWNNDAHVNLRSSKVVYKVFVNSRDDNSSISPCREIPDRHSQLKKSPFSIKLIFLMRFKIILSKNEKNLLRIVCGKFSNSFFCTGGSVISYKLFLPIESYKGPFLEKPKVLTHFAEIRVIVSYRGPLFVPYSGPFLYLITDPLKFILSLTCMTRFL